MTQVAPAKGMLSTQRTKIMARALPLAARRRWPQPCMLTYFPLHHRRAPTKVAVLAARSLATTPPPASTTATTPASAPSSAASSIDAAPSSRPTRKTFQHFLALARPEAPAFLTALMAVAVGTGTTVVFPFAIGKCMDAMTLGSSKGVASKVGEVAAGELGTAVIGDFAPTQAGADLSMNAREFIEASFGPGATPIWLLDIIPPDAAPLSVLSTGLVGVFVLGAFATFVRNTTVHLAGERIAARLRKRVFAAVLHQRLAFFDRTRTGELMNRLSNDVTQVAKTLSEDTSYFLRNFAQGAGALGMMLYTSPQLCAIMLGVIPPVAVWGVFFGRKVRALSKQMVDELAQAGSIAEERISNVRTVRALGNDELEVGRYAHQVDNVFRVAKHKSLLQGIYYGVAMGSGNLGMVTVLYFGGQYVSEGLITIGDLSTMLLYSVYAGFSISALLSYYGDLMKAAGSAERIFDLMDTDNQARRDRAAREVAAVVRAYNEKGAEGKMMTAPCVLPTVRGPLVFEKVSFAYPTRPDFPVFHNLDLEVRENETLALVGPSGSGKSSLAALVTRMYEPDGGQILLGPERVPLERVPRQHLRKSISYVTQDAVLFSGTVRDNLFLGFPDLEPPHASIEEGLNLFPLLEPQQPFFFSRGKDGKEAWNMEERMTRVREACRTANCLDFIEQWDDGFDTVIGERGAQLSGGQRARLALARAILRDSHVLLLDEISAALDSVSEAALHSALQRVLKGRTTLLIAHRWSSIQIADRIAVLGDGKVIEIGTPQDLLSASTDSAFRRLVEHQLKSAHSCRGGF